jgi:hypothetical protein
MPSSHLHLQHPFAFTTVATTKTHQSIQVPYHRIIASSTDPSHYNPSRHWHALQTSRFWTRIDDHPLPIPFNPPTRIHDITTYPPHLHLHRSVHHFFFHPRLRRPLHSYGSYYTVQYNKSSRTTYTMLLIKPSLTLLPVLIEARPAFIARSVLKKVSLAGSRTPLSRVTGGCTNRYTTRDIVEKGSICAPICVLSFFLLIPAVYLSQPRAPSSSPPSTAIVYRHGSPYALDKEDFPPIWQHVSHISYCTPAARRRCKHTVPYLQRPASYFVHRLPPFHFQ